MSDNALARYVQEPGVLPQADATLAAAGGLTVILAAAPATRAEALGYIQEQFRLHFGASIVDDVPILMLCRAASGAVVAAWGLRRLDDGLFSACYLDRELLDSLSPVSDSPPGVDEVVELSHLSVRHPKVLLALIPLLAQVLAEMKFRYLVCTATGCLTRFFQRRGFSPLVLAAADRQKLAPDDRDRWGTYYDHNPMVLAGRIDNALDSRPSR
ncbi:MAG: thermostable hemolysin [Pseudomonadales bacterium]|nr:thermostable hemolysin [Pseudomonadales bacterium]